MNEREKVAKELAEKDGAGWEGLNEIMKNAYLHNADLVIQERNPTPVESDTGKPIYTCDRCKDKAYLGDKPCLECNPRGLPVEEVHPVLLIEVKHQGMPIGEVVEVKEREDGLDVVAKLIPEGSDLLKKIGMIAGEPEAPESPLEPKPSEYHCTRCNTLHRKTSNIGQKHLK